MAIATLGRYRLSSRLPADGTAEVWRAVEVGAGGLERPALVRLWPTGERLGDEVRRSFALSHQNVVAVRDAGELDGRAWVATEWVEGEALGAILQRLGQPLPLRFACLVAVEAARGLDYAGRAG